MKVKEKKTVRFDALIKKSGRPEQATLWTKPEHDREFMTAVKALRVVTVVQHNVGTKKDFGLVGFFPKEKATFLVFPKQIRESKETKIVGIKYDLLAQSIPKGPVHRTREQSSPRSRKQITKAAPAGAKPTLKRYRVTVATRHTGGDCRGYPARNSVEAAKAIKAHVSGVSFDSAKAKVTRKAGKTKELRRPLS